MHLRSNGHGKRGWTGFDGSNSTDDGFSYEFSYGVLIGMFLAGYGLLITKTPITHHSSHWIRKTQGLKLHSIAPSQRKNIGWMKGQAGKMCTAY